MLCHSRLGAVWVLLAAVAAIELYDGLPPAELDNEVIYQDSNVIDTGPLRALYADDTETTGLKDLLLFRLIESQLKELRNSEHRMHKELGQTPGASDANTLTKRFTQLSKPRPQQRWKTKKGKIVGSQMVCYFKLCAFRNPA